MPATAFDVSGRTYTFGKNLLGWENLEFFFEDGTKTARLYLNNYPVLEIGLDNVYRLTNGGAIGELLLRGQWADEQTFIVDYPYPAAGATVLGDLEKLNSDLSLLAICWR